MRRPIEVKTDEEAGEEMVSMLEVEGKGGFDADVDTFEDKEGMVNGFWNEETEEEEDMLSGRRGEETGTGCGLIKGRGEARGVFRKLARTGCSTSGGHWNWKQLYIFVKKSDRVWSRSQLVQRGMERWTGRTATHHASCIINESCHDLGVVLNLVQSGPQTSGLTKTLSSVRASFARATSL